MVDTIEASVHLLQCWIIHIVEFVIYILRNFDPCSCFLIFLWHRYDNFCFFRDFYAYLSILSFFFFRTGYIIILIEIPVYISTYIRIIYLSQFLESSCQYLWLFCHRLVCFWFFEYYGCSQVYICWGLWIFISLRQSYSKFLRISLLRHWFVIILF